MQRETGHGGWARYGQVSRSAQDCEGVRMGEAPFFEDMLDIILHCFGLLLLVGLGAAVVWEVFGVVGIIVCRAAGAGPRDRPDRLHRSRPERSLRDLA